MKKSKFSVAALLLGIVFWLSLLFTGTEVYADTSESKGLSSSITITGLTQDEKNKIEELCKNINTDLNNSGYFKVAKNGTAGLLKQTQLNDVDFITTESKKDDSLKKLNNTSLKSQLYSVNITANWNLYNGYDTDQKTEIYQIILADVQSQNNQVSQGTRIKIYNYFVDNDSTTSNLVRQLSVDVNADLANGYSAVKPITGFISTVFGVLAIVIFLGLTTSILIDLAYIVIPTLQLADNGKEPPKFLFIKVSNEAWTAVHESEKSNSSTKKLAVSLYFQTRTKQIFIIGICLLYLVSGKIYTLLAWLIDSFQGFLPE